MPMPTTRRGRFLWRRQRYLRKARRYESFKWQWERVLPGNNKRVGLKTTLNVVGEQKPCGVSSRSYAASPLVVPAPFAPYSVSPAGRALPPHVKILGLFYLFVRGLGYHQRSAIVEFHAKPVKAYRRLSSVKRSARDRQITGANFRYFKTGYYPDWDVLGRHPNETDETNGVGPGTTLWPVPLGY